MMSIMYIGPSITGLVRKNQIFLYDPKLIIAAAKEIYPGAGALFIPINKIVEKKYELAREGSALNVAYKKIEKIYRR